MIFSIPITQALGQENILEKSITDIYGYTGQSSEKEIKNNLIDSNKLATVRLPFIENVGQINGDVKFYTNTFAGTVYVTDNDITYQSITDNQNSKYNAIIIKEKFLGKINPTGLDKRDTIVNYFKGSEENWKTNIPTYGLVDLGYVWPSIDVKLKSYGNNIEKIFTVQPGGSTNNISIRFDGITDLAIAENGELVVNTELGSITLSKPIAYQDIDGVRNDVLTEYNIIDSTTYGFSVLSYDPRYDLIIDPLLASTFIGGSDNDQGLGITLDSTGNVYVTGIAGDGLITAFPTTVGAYDTTYNGSAFDVFVSKFDSGLTTLLASTFIGGSAMDQGLGITLDSTGNVYVTGLTNDGVTDLPTTVGAYDTTHNGGGADVFVSKFDSGLTTLLASTFIGGSGGEAGHGIKLDSTGNVYITGSTSDGVTDLPTTVGAYDTTHSAVFDDVFVSKFDSGLTTLLASTFIGGDSTDIGYAITLDSTGNVYITGITSDGTTDLPTTVGAYDTTHNGSNDVFVSKFDSGLTTLSASTFIGSSSSDAGYAITLDSTGNVYITGTTPDVVTDFPTTVGAYDTTHNGVNDVFVSKFNSGLTTLSASTFIGGDNDDQGLAITLDSTGNVYITGITNDGTTELPTTVGAYDTTQNGNNDVFVSKFNSGLTTLSASTFIGGSGADQGSAILLDSTGNVYITGLTIDDVTDLPTTVGAYDTTHDFNYDVFVSRFSSDLSGPISLNSLVYEPTDTVIVTVTDSAANLSALALDTVIVNAFSDTDGGGIMRTLVETGVNTGIFTGTFGLTLGPSTPAILQVTVGDTLTVSYGSFNALASIVANTSPVANDDKFTTQFETAANNLNVLLNDTDADLDPLTVSAIGSILNGGTAVINATNNGINFTPATGFRGVDRFTYGPSDGNGGGDNATVNVVILGINGKIGFSTDRNGNSEAYAMNSDGSGQTNLSSNVDYDYLTGWSPNGTKIAFYTNRDSGNWEIYTMNADGSGQTRITNDLASDEAPSWSPDGTKFAFMSDRDDVNFEIYTMNADGTGVVTRLTSNTAFEQLPVWSPDGTKIAFESQRDGNSEIYIMNADGSGQTNLSNNGSGDSVPSWSPDGTKIAFHSDRDGNREIYIMNAVDGSGQTRVTTNAALDGQPTWSPDGTKIAFLSDRDGNNEIYVMNVGGSGQTRLTNNAANDFAPIWGTAPNTSSITVQLDSDQYQVNTGGVVTVTDSAANLSPVVIDTVSVHMNSTTDSTGFSVILSEPNVNAGYFVSPQITFSSAATNAAQLILRAPAGSIVYANYIQSDSALIIPATGAFGTPDALRFDVDLYVQESSGLIKVIDAAANNNAATQQTITVHVSSVGTPSGFNVPLLEDAINSGTFTTTQAITFTLGSSVTPNRLHVIDPSDTVTATYSSFTPATATIVRPFSPPFPTGIPDPTVDIGCSVDTDNDGLCDDMEDQGTHPGLLSIEHPTAAFTYEYGGVTCKPLIDDPAAIDGSPEDIAYGSLDDVPACPDINTRDIYVEIDYMTNHKPDASALVQVVRAFESAPDPDGSGPIKPGIKLHLQVDEDISFHQVSIPQNDVAPFDAANPHGGYFQIKQEKFRTAEERSGSLGDKQLILETKRQAFHYALFGHNYNEAPGSSGWAEILGNDIMISMGEFERHVGSPSQQAGTLFHEIGHSINLDHGGNVADPRCKPNYISAMSYAYQFPTFVANRPLDFSRSAMTQLTESSLQESLGFDRTSPPGLTAVYGGVTGGVALSPVKTAKTNDATMGLVLDGTNLYITDPGNDRVRKITNTFTTTSTFGATGTTDGLFKSPEGVAVNSTHIIVADSGNNRIQIFLKSDLTFKAKTGTLGPGLGQFNSPEGVGINSTHIIVADTGNDRLQRFSKSLLSPIIVGSSGSGNGQFKSPWAVAFDGSNNLYVVDSGNNRIQKFGPNGVYLDQVGTRGSGPGQFISPRGIAISAGIVYVSDTGNNRIQKFTTSTLDLVTPPSEFGIFGTSTGQFNSTEGVAVGGSPTSYIYVADTGNKRVQKFVTSTLGYDSTYAPTGTSAFKVSTPVPVNFNRVAPSTETVSQAIHVLSGVSGCTVADGSTPITIYGINDWANINLKFRDSNYFSDGQTQDPAALHELKAGDNNQQLSSTIIILNELIQALEPAEFSDQTAGFALQDSLNIDLNNANDFVIAGDLNSALGILQGTVQTSVNALPITLEAEDKKVEILLALQNAITAIQSALEPPAISQIFADDDTATTNQGVPVNISVLVNDGSDAGSTISIASFTQGTKGVVTNNGGGILKYTPNAGQIGADSFTYTISNGAGQTDSAKVTITIIPVAPSFTLKWGSSGTSDGKFNSPTGIDTDSTGKVYVSDSGNNRIQKFSSTGTFDRKWGSFGTSDGKFNNPTGVDVDSTGKVYVSDSGNNRIQKFSSTGTFDRKWGSPGTGNSQFKNPNGIGIDLVANKVYVSDSDNNRIQKFSSTGTFDIKWGSFGTGNSQFKKPRVAAVDSAGNVYVTDSVNNRIQKFSSAGTFILQWGSSGTTDGKFKNPTGIDVDSTGNVYVADTDNHRIQKFTSTGTFIVKWGSFGTGNGQFKNPIGIAVDSTGNVYIADTGNHRIQKFVP